MIDIKDMTTDGILEELSRRFPVGMVFGALTEDPSIDNPLVFTRGAPIAKNAISEFIMATSQAEYQSVVSAMMTNFFNGQGTDFDEYDTDDE